MDLTQTRTTSFEETGVSHSPFVSPRRPLTSALFLSPRATRSVSPPRHSDQPFSMAAFIARQDAEVQKRQRKVEENERFLATQFSGSLSPRRPLTSAVFESTRGSSPSKAQPAPEKPFQLAEFIARQDAEVKKRQRKLEENAKFLATEFSFTPQLTLRDEDDPPSGDLTAFLSRLDDDIKKKTKKAEQLREKYQGSNLPLVGSRGQSRAWGAISSKEQERMKLLATKFKANATSTK